MSQASTNAHLPWEEVFFLLNPLVGDPEITAVLIFCDDSGQLGCCYPHYIRENEDAGRVTKMSPDRLVEVWTEEGTTFAVRRG